MMTTDNNVERNAIRHYIQDTNNPCNGTHKMNCYGVPVNYKTTHTLTA